MNDHQSADSGELLSCPFCGDAPRTLERPDNIDGTRFFYAVACYCGGYSATAHKMAIRDTAEEAKAEAIAAWNRRASPPVQGGAMPPIPAPAHFEHLYPDAAMGYTCPMPYYTAEQMREFVLADRLQRHTASQEAAQAVEVLRELVRVHGLKAQLSRRDWQPQNASITNEQARAATMELNTGVEAAAWDRARSIVAGLGAAPLPESVTAEDAARRGEQ